MFSETTKPNLCCREIQSWGWMFNHSGCITGTGDNNSSFFFSLIENELSFTDFFPIHQPLPVSLGNNLKCMFRFNFFIPFFLSPIKNGEVVIYLTKLNLKLIPTEKYN